MPGPVPTTNPYTGTQPENIIIGGDGLPRICDWGLAKQLRKGQATYTMCGSPTYMSPEMIIGKGHTIAADMWSFGVLIWEMLIGKTPFETSSSTEPIIILKTILTSKVKCPPKTPKAAAALVKLLFEREPGRRLGCGSAGIRAVKSHSYFSKIDFDKLREGKIDPPYLPDVDVNKNFIENIDAVPYKVEVFKDDDGTFAADF